MDLDTMLNEAAPRLADRTPDLTELLDELVVAARPPAGRRHRRLAVVGGAVGLIGAVGFGGAAAAGVGPDMVQGLFPWTSGEGSSCEVVASLEPRGVGDPNYSASQGAAMASAHAWLASFDVDEVDRDAAEERWFAYLEDVSVGNPSRSGLEEKFTGDRLEAHALSHEVSQQLDRHLQAQGFDPRSLNGAVAVQCGE